MIQSVITTWPNQVTGTINRPTSPFDAGAAIRERRERPSRRLPLSSFVESSSMFLATLHLCDFAFEPGMVLTPRCQGAKPPDEQRRADRSAVTRTASLRVGASVGRNSGGEKVLLTEPGAWAIAVAPGIMTATIDKTSSASALPLFRSCVSALR